MSFLSALASSWDICKRTCFDCRQHPRLLKSFYETYDYDKECTLVKFPPRPYQNKYVIRECKTNGNYRVRVGLTTLEDKLVNSFFGLPFAILQTLSFLVFLVVGVAWMVGSVIFILSSIISSPLMLLFARDTSIKNLLYPLLCKGFENLGVSLLLTTYCLFQVIFQPLKALIKIPVGIIIGIKALIKLARGQPIEPKQKTISDMEMERLRLEESNEFERALQDTDVDINQIPLGNRYICPINFKVIVPTLLNDGFIYDKHTAVELLKSKKRGPFDRTFVFAQAHLVSYYNDTKALVNALITERTNAKTANRSPNYELILQCTEKHTAIAEALLHTIREHVNDILIGKKDITAITSFTVTAQKQEYQFNVSASVIQTALEIIGSMIKIDTAVAVKKEASAQEAVTIFLDKLTRKQEYQNLFTTALKEAILAEQDFAKEFETLTGHAEERKTSKFWSGQQHDLVNSSSNSDPNLGAKLFY